MQKTFNLTRTKELVRNYLTAEQKPQFILTLESPPGQGKTSLVKSIVSELGMKLLTIPCSSITKQTFQLSFVSENNLTTLVLDTLEDENSVILFEELDRTPTTVFPILLPLFAGRLVGNVVARCSMIATINFADRLSAIDTALPSRLIRIPVKSEITEIFQYISQKYLSTTQRETTLTTTNNNNTDPELIEKIIVAFRMTCDQIAPDGEIFNPRMIDNLIEATKVLKLNYNEAITVIETNLPTEIAEVVINHLLYEDIPSVSSGDKLLDFIFTKQPTGKNFFALRQLVLHLSQCGNDKCNHPSIQKLVKRLVNAPMSLVDTFVSSILDIPESQRAILIDQMTKTTDIEPRKMTNLYDMIGKIITPPT